MDVKSVSFTGHKKQQTPIESTLSVALKGGIGAAAGFALGRYVLPTSKNLAELVFMNNLVDTFVEKQPKPKSKKSKVNTEDAKQTKITTPKAKTNLYVKLKGMVLKGILATKEKAVKTTEDYKLESLYKKFQDFSVEFFAVNGGKENCVTEVRNSLRTTVGKKIALFTGVIFTSAAIVDQIFKSSHEKRHH